eukprot:gb/GECH01005681.1/.p1 GENE.gb/GECH01005681.1/~~gb/GECH01005681.1/.p1  ORF type:complete len:195 (+),score=7.31 gb/GECH01005681.1/:1-585(+)
MNKNIYHIILNVDTEKASKLNFCAFEKSCHSNKFNFNSTSTLKESTKYFEATTPTQEFNELYDSAKRVEETYRLFQLYKGCFSCSKGNNEQLLIQVERTKTHDVVKNLFGYKLEKNDFDHNNESRPNGNVNKGEVIQMFPLTYCLIFPQGKYAVYLNGFGPIVVKAADTQPNGSEHFLHKHSTACAALRVTGFF